MGLRTPLVAVGAVLLAALAWRDAATAFWLRAGAENAPEPFAADPRIALAAATVEDDAVGPEVPALARAALRVEPLDAAAVGQLGVAADAAGRKDALATLLLAERISRRDVPAQITLLRLAAEANDYRPSFMRLDTILTVDPSAGARFFAPMATLTGDPQARAMLAGLAGRPWFGAFVAAAVRQAENPADLAALLVASRKPLPPAQAGELPRLLARLAEAGDYAAAQNLALRYGGASPAALGDFALTRATTDPRFAPLTWRLGASDAVQAALAGEGVLDVELRPGRAVPVAERATRLAPGPYALAQRVTRGDEGGPLLFAWEMRCSTRSPVVWREVVPLRQTTTEYRARLDVPQGCPVQHWRLTALADDSQSTAAFRIAGLRLTPAP